MISYPALSHRTPKPPLHLGDHSSFVQPSSLDKLRNLIFARLIRVRLPDLIQRYKLLRALHNSLHVHRALCKPVHKLLDSVLRSLRSAPRVTEGLESVGHACGVHLEPALGRLEDDSEEHCGNGNHVWCMEEGKVCEVVVVDDGPR
jgi:hypothetical protein